MILKTIKQTITVDVPTEIKCDVCGNIVAITSEYELKSKNKASDHMAVVTYGYPSGGFSNNVILHKLHCCCTNCVAAAIKKVPFDATITIPMSDKFKK